MIRLELKTFLTGTMVRRILYRAVCKDGATRMGYLCFMVKKHWLRPATEEVYLREHITGKLFKFRPETLAIWTMTCDTNGRPICNGDMVLREDTYTGAKIRGEIVYCINIAGFVWRSTEDWFKRSDPMYSDIEVSNDNREHKVHYSYTLITK